MKIARLSNSHRFATALIEDGGARLLEPWREGDPMGTPFTLPEAATSAGERLSLESVEFLPPLSAGTKVICLGLNYRDHIAETGSAGSDTPPLFIKFPDALVGHKQPLIRPKVSEAFDYEGEIAVVIGRRGRHIAKADAMRHVYGYTMLMDGSVRDYQQHSPSAGKCFHRSGAAGPWIVTADEIADYRRMALHTTLNGERVQSATVDLMIYDIPAAIEYISRWTPLAPGDIISTGTPSGVGAARQPPLWMKPGDVVEVIVTGIGTLSNTVADEQS